MNRRRVLSRIVASCSAMLALGRALPALGESDHPLKAPIHAVFVSDDDGSKPAPIRPEQVTPWVEFANNTFAPAGIRFEYEPETSDGRGDWSQLRNTRINNMEGTSDKEWRTARAEANRIAAQHPGKLVVFFRFGPSRTPTGGGFSWID